MNIYSNLYSQKNNYFYFISNLGAFLFFSLSLTVDNGYNYGAIVIALTAIIGAPLWWREKVISKEYFKLCLVFIFISFTGILDAWLIHSQGTEYNIPSKFILATLILLYIIKFPPKMTIVLWGISIGAIGAGLSAVYYTYIEPIPRGSAYLNPIHFGDYSILFSIICLWALFPLKGISKKLVIFLILGCFFGITASILSGSRGSWFSFILTMITLVIINFKQIKKNSLLKIGFPISLLLILSITFFGKDRINQAIYEVGNYQNNKHSSVGARLEMWKFGISTAIKHPIIGANSKGLLKEQDYWVNKHGEGSKIIKSFGHLHNEFINILAIRGLVGLTALLLLFLYPLSIYIRERKKKNSPQQIKISNIAIIHIVSFMGFGLTEVLLGHYNSAFIMFILPLCIFYAIYNKEKA